MGELAINGVGRGGRAGRGGEDGRLHRARIDQARREFAPEQITELADSIRAEVGIMMKDVRLLGERARKLQQHFNQSNEDVRQMLISIEKIEKRSDRIAQVEMGGEAEEVAGVIAAPVFKLEASNP